MAIIIKNTIPNADNLGELINQTTFIDTLVEYAPSDIVLAFVHALQEQGCYAAAHELLDRWAVSEGVSGEVDVTLDGKDTVFRWATPEGATPKASDELVRVPTRQRLEWLTDLAEEDFDEAIRHLRELDDQQPNLYALEDVMRDFDTK